MARKETRVVEIRIDSKEFRRAVRDVNANLRSIKKEAGRVSTGLRDMMNLFAAHEVIQWTKGLVLAASEVERLDKVLLGASDSQEGFADSLDFVRELADEYGLSMLRLQEGFAHFVAAGRGAGLEMGTIEETFTGLTVAAAAFRVEGTELQLMLQGARQLMGSATVNMEDLRQVTERLPNGMQAAVQATRELTGDLELNQQSMKKLISEGKIATDEFFPLFAKRLEQINLKGATDNSNSFSASLARLNNAFRELLRTLVDLGLLEALADAVNLMGATVSFIDRIISGGSFSQAVAAATGVSDLAGELTVATELVSTLQRDIEKGFGGADVQQELQDRLAMAQQEVKSIEARIDGQHQYNQLMAEQNKDLTDASGLLDDIASKITGMGAGGTTNLGGGSVGAAGLRAATEETAAAVKAFEDMQDTIREMREEFFPTEKIANDYAETMTDLWKALEIGTTNQGEFNILAAEAQRVLHESTKAAQDQIKATEGVMSEFSTAVSGFFGDMILGANSFESAIASLEQAILSMITNALVLEPLENILTGKDAFGSGSSAANLVGTVVGGLGKLWPFADGGDYSAGQPMLVGERGPEIVIPSTGGTVIPNDAMGGQTIIINFTGSVSGEGLRQSATQIAALVGAQTARATKRLS